MEESLDYSSGTSPPLRPVGSDLPFRFIIAAAARLGSLLRLDSEEGAPHWSMIALVVVLFFDGVVLFSAIATGNFASDNDPQRLTFVEDTWNLATLVLLPVTAVLAYDFYSRLDPVLDRLHEREILTGPFSEWKTSLDARMNWPVIYVAVAFTVVLAQASLALWPHDRRSWFEDTPLVYSWMLGWAFLALFSLTAFAWKTSNVWLAVRDTTRGDSGLQFCVQFESADGCGGFAELARTWFRVHLVVVAAGIHIYGSAMVYGNLSNPATIAAELVYWPLALCLFFGAFWHIHVAMVKQKNARIAKVRRELDLETERRRPRAMAILALKEDLSRAEKYPEWPFPAGLTERVFGSYCLPGAFFVAGQVVSF